MHRLNARRAVACALGMVLVGSLSLSACVLPPDNSGAGAAASGEPADGGGGEAVESGAVTIPTSWPASVPVYEGGTLVSADGDETATFFTAVWTVDEAPDVVAAEYGAALVAAGLTQGEPFIDETSALADYTGDGIIVSVYASIPSDGETTELAVSVQPSV